MTRATYKREPLCVVDYHETSHFGDRDQRVKIYIDGSVEIWDESEFVELKADPVQTSQLCRDLINCMHADDATEIYVLNDVKYHLVVCPGEGVSEERFWNISGNNTATDTLIFSFLDKLHNGK